MENRLPRSMSPPVESLGFTNSHKHLGENTINVLDQTSAHPSAESSNVSKVLDSSNFYSEKQQNSNTSENTNQRNSDNFVIKWNSYEFDKVSTRIDKHNTQLKKGLMDEILQMKRELAEKQTQILEEYKHQIAVDLRKSQKEVNELSTIIEKLAKTRERRELLIERLVNSRGAKCIQITDLRSMRRAFVAWKRYTDESKHLKSLQSRAETFRNQRLLGKFFNEWRIDSWRSKKTKVEEMWRKRMEEVTNNLVRQYESELAIVRSQLEEAEESNRQYKAEREAYQEEMKKAFMRGVSALNLEAISIFPKNTAPPKALNQSKAVEFSMEVPRQVSTPIQQDSRREKPQIPNPKQNVSQSQAPSQGTTQRPGAVVVTRHQHSQPLTTVKVPVLANSEGRARGK